MTTPDRDAVLAAREARNAKERKAPLASVNGGASLDAKGLASLAARNIARGKKVLLLAAVCVKQDVTAKDLDTLDLMGWAALTALADVNAPSDVTKRAVTDLVRRMEEGRL